VKRPPCERCYLDNIDITLVGSLLSSVGLGKILRPPIRDLERLQTSRLNEVGLTYKDVDGFYHLSPYGLSIQILLEEFEFISKNSDYFVTHSLAHIRPEFVKRIGELSGSFRVDSVVDFLHNVENVIKKAEEYVCFNVDQYPVTALSSIVEALGRGIEFRIIEQEDRITGPNLVLQTSDEVQAMSRARSTPLIEQRTSDRVDVILYISEKSCVLAFPDINRDFDYRGFTTTDERPLKWCRDLFQNYWEVAEPRVYTSPTEYVRPTQMHLPKEEAHRIIVVVGHDDSRVDAQAVQDAVDNYDEVILRGTFNFGPSKVEISRSVVVKGEGREDDIPETTIYKKGWAFPFREWDCVFYIDSEDAGVTIENIQFTDFNCACIWGKRGNSLIIEDNRITLPTGYGRGITYGAFGDWVIGIHVEPHEDSLRGGVTIKGNYIDFSYRGSLWGGHVSRGGLEEDPEYRPDLFNHEYYVGLGITVWNLPGSVRIENNIVRNTNARGIAVSNNLASADVRIRNNTVVSDVYGSYLFSSPEAGAGILAQSTFNDPRSGFNVEIEDNTIKLDKLNYSGIIVLGPTTDREGADKLRGGIIRNNRIRLKNGYEGIHVRKCDDFEVADNKISGEAYYGIRISGRKRSRELDLKALNNKVEGNDMGDLRIRDPDEYSDSHVDGRMFTGSEGRSATAHMWLNAFSKDNVIEVRADETVIDEGEDNKITYIDN